MRTDALDRPIARLRTLWQTQPWRRLADRLRPHALPLALVGLACAVGQLATLMQPANIRQWPDTAQYAAVAARIVSAHQPFDPVRTPGYPLLLAVVIWLTGHLAVHAVVLAQAAIMVVATLEIYALAYRLCGRRWEAGALAALLGLNLYILDWERLLLSETLAYGLVVTLALVFERYLSTARSWLLLALALLSAAAILTRPIFLYLPVVLFAVLILRGARLGQYRLIWTRLAPALALVYGLVVLYMAGNALTYGYFGLSSIGSVNLLAKVMELHHTYGMPLTGAAPRFAHLQADVQAYLASGQSDGWRFVDGHPQDAAGDRSVYGVYGTYSAEILAHHPGYLLRGSLADSVTCWLVRPWAWAPFSVAPTWLVLLLHLAALENRAYLLLPLLLVALPIWLWRRPDSVRAAALCMLVLSSAGLILMAGATDYAEFYRLRFPLDWATILVASVVGIEVLYAGVAALTGWRASPAPPLALPARLRRSADRVATPPTPPR